LNEIKKQLIVVLTVSAILTAMPVMSQPSNTAILTLLAFVKVQGRQLMFWNKNDGKYEPYVIRGVGYNPTPIGRYSSDWGYYISASNPNPSNLPNNMFADPAILTRDFSLLQSMNANTIRIWGADNSLETGSNQPVFQTSFENAFPLQAPGYGDNIYSWLLQNDYVMGNGYVNPNVSLTSSTVLSALKAEFTDPGEYYTVLDILRKAFYGDTSPGRFPNMLTPTTLATAGSYGLKVIPGFWVGPFGSCNYATSPCVYSLNTYNSESNDPDLKVPFDLTNPYIANDILMRFEIYVNTFKNDPNILFWAIGNENNLSFDPNSSDPNFNTTAQIKAWYSLVNQMSAAAHAIEGANYHPVAVVNGDDNFKTLGNSNYGADDASLSNVDIWGMNSYRGQSFYDFFVKYKSLTGKPLWISEYGIDAWQSCTAANPAISGCDPNDPSSPAAASAPAFPYQKANDEVTQATWDGELWNEIAGNGDITIGGTVMEYSDEWWKPDDWMCVNNPNYIKYALPGTDPASYCHWNHFYFGFGPGSSYWNASFNAPDHYFNESWWGLMGISNPSPETKADTMNPRQAYYALQGEFLNSVNNVALPSYMVLPVNDGTPLNLSNVTFTWSKGVGVSQYELIIGTTNSASDIYSNSSLSATSVKVSGIPLTGKSIYVQLGSYINGAWATKNYTYLTVDKIPPTVPVGLRASPVITAGNTTKLSWNASTDNIAVAGYTVLRNGEPVANITSTSWTDTQVSPGINSYQVLAYDQAGNKSGLSNKVQVIQASIPVIINQPVSQTVSIFTVFISGASFRVTAVGIPAPSYQWFKVTNGIKSVISGAKSATYIVHSGTPGRVYYYLCVVTNPGGSVQSNLVSLKIKY